MRQAHDFDRDFVLGERELLIRLQDHNGTNWYQSLGLRPKEGVSFEEAWEEFEDEVLNAFANADRLIIPGLGAGFDMAKFRAVMVGDYGSLDILI